MNTTDNQPTAAQIADELGAEERKLLVRVATNGYKDNEEPDWNDVEGNEYATLWDKNLIARRYERTYATELGKHVFTILSQPPITQEEINDYLRSQGQDPKLLADAFHPSIEKAILERQEVIDMLKTPVRIEAARTSAPVAGKPANETADGSGADELQELKNEIIWEYENGHTRRAIYLYRELYKDYIHEPDDIVSRAISHMIKVQMDENNDSQIKQLQAEITALRAALSAASEREKTLRELAGRAADKLQWSMLAGYPESEVRSIKDDLRKAAKEGEG